MNGRIRVESNALTDLRVQGKGREGDGKERDRHKGETVEKRRGESEGLFFVL